MSLPCPIWSTSSCPRTRRFLQRATLADGNAPDRQGLEEVFQEIFPIESPNGDMVLEFVGYSLDESGIKLTEQECKHKGLSFVIPIKAKINLVFWGTARFARKKSTWATSRS